jgi:alpha-1,6-mannosyltransferase
MNFNLVTTLRTRFGASSAAAAGCAVILLLGCILLSSIGGEAGGDHILPWLATLAGLTLVWLVSLGSKPVSPWVFMGVAIGIRVIFLIMPTGFDTYRYVWEGKVLLHGFNPYIHPPDDPLLQGLRDSAWHSIGLRGATAIYPPLVQWIFAGLSSCGLGVWGFKFIFTLGDLTLCGILLTRFGSKSARIYAWNPLAALSVAGGGHYDCLLMLAMVLAWLAYQRDVGFPFRAAILIGIAIALKWMALPIALWLVIHELRQRGLRSAFIAGILVAAPVACSYIAISLWTGEWTLQLMPPLFSRTARSMEFLPIIFDYLGRVGPLDNRIYFVILLVFWAVVASRARSFLEATEWSFFATYLLSPMLHAWYLVWILPFAVKSRNLGIIALAASGIFYFIVHYNTEQPGGAWTYNWWQRCIIWLPFIVGFLMMHINIRRKLNP